MMRTGVLLSACRLACALTAMIATGCAEGPRPAMQADCDPLSPACPADEHCRIVADGARCLPQVSPPSGVACTPGSCGPGEACTVVEGALGCRPLCDPDEVVRACPEGRICGYLLPAVGLGVCPAPCGPCADGTTCAPTTALPYPICVASGPLDEGAPCGGTRCGVGLACLAPAEGEETRCTAVCQSDDACAMGRCGGTIVGVEGIGYCIDDS